MKPFTLHVRLTRDCNAHCSYCSSAGVAAGRMTPQDFKTCVTHIAHTIFPKIGVGKNHFLTIEYLGGEVLTLPEDELAECVTFARNIFAPLVKQMRDGAQSNLIGSPRKVLALHDLFEGNLGTSWETKSGERKIGNSHELYKAIALRSITTLKRERNHNPGRVVVVDKHTAPHLCEEVKTAQREGHDLVLRPVFQGGSPNVEHADIDTLNTHMLNAYKTWRENPVVRVEPFSGFYERRKLRNLVDPNGEPAANKIQGCPFQSDCAFKSLSLDPDGSLYVCQEMADAKHHPLGNALTQTFHTETWKKLARRTAMLSKDCQVCTWKTECGGGCMNEAIERFGDPFAKTELCSIWKTLFAAVDNDLRHTNTRKESSHERV